MAISVVGTVVLTVCWHNYYQERHRFGKAYRSGNLFICQAIDGELAGVATAAGAIQSDFPELS
jgi:hypothetical protein